VDNTKKIDYSRMYLNARFIHPYFLFTEITKTLPSVRIYQNINPQTLYFILIKEFSVDEKQIMCSELYNKEIKKSYISTYLIFIKKDLWVYYDTGNENNSSEAARILFPNSKRKLYSKLIIRLEQTICKHFVEPKLNSLYLLTQSEHIGLDLKRFNLKPYDIDIKRNYNDDFENIDWLILNRLNTQNDKGLVLLHGLPGTGKTTYVRYLLSKINKNIIYIQPELAAQIGSPTFMTFLMDHPNCVLVIEDAEVLLKERQRSENTAISNLLNLSDGLLSDCLNIQLVCTFNTGLSDIDGALLRKGRLIARYEFKPLEKDKAQALSNYLGYETILEKETTLTEIYNQGQVDFNKKQNKIGFK